MARAHHVDGYEEISDIRNDLNALKIDIAALSRHMQDDGMEKVRKLGEGVQDTTRAAAGRIISQGEDGAARLGNHVKNNPGTSMLMAFCGGLLLHAMLGRK